MPASDAEDLGTLQRALALDAEGRWAEAHDLVADTDGALAAWVHAYLHRKEGDLGNAKYWYTRAGEKPRTCSLAEEHAELTGAVGLAINDAR